MGSTNAAIILGDDVKGKGVIVGILQGTIPVSSSILSRANYSSESLVASMSPKY
ncbi:MAG: hypothetical protein ACJ0DJ_00125 [bacterium]